MDRLYISGDPKKIAELFNNLNLLRLVDFLVCSSDSVWYPELRYCTGVPSDWSRIVEQGILLTKMCWKCSFYQKQGGRLWGNWWLQEYWKKSNQSKFRKVRPGLVFTNWKAVNVHFFSLSLEKAIKDVNVEDSKSTNDVRTFWDEAWKMSKKRWV